MEREDELDARLREMRTHFLVPASGREIFAALDASAELLPPESQPVVKALRHNLSSALSTVAMPFALASASARQTRFVAIHGAELIRARSIDETAVPLGEDLKTVREREAHKKASGRLQEFAASRDGRNALMSDTCGFLLASLKFGLESAAEELIQQGLVLVWSAFEVFCRDAFEAILNRDPAKVRLLVDHPTTRKRFEAERLPLETLVQYGFDLSARFGSVLVAQQDFSDLRTIKAVFPVLFQGDTQLNHALGERDLWTLYQRRHLVVHRRGVIDQAYLDATGETPAVGTRLIVTPRDFEVALNVVVSAATATVRCLA